MALLKLSYALKIPQLTTTRLPEQSTCRGIYDVHGTSTSTDADISGWSRWTSDLGRSEPHDPAQLHDIRLDQSWTTVSTEGPQTMIEHLI